MPTQPPFRVQNPPIIEAILDFQCDLDPTLDRIAFEREARQIFADHYPNVQTALMHESEISIQPNQPPRSVVRQQTLGFQFFTADRKQIIQAKFNGFSFNRLAPYTSLDDYLPEIKRCWLLYQSFARVRMVRRISLRYINRILLPLTNGQVDLEHYFENGPRLPPFDKCPMTLTGFVHQFQAHHLTSQSDSRIVLATQVPENKKLPIVLDIDAFKIVETASNNWELIAQIVASLRDLKNDLFRYTLTPECLNLFQPPSSP